MFSGSKGPEEQSRYG